MENLCCFKIERIYLLPKTVRLHLPIYNLSQRWLKNVNIFPGVTLIDGPFQCSTSRQLSYVRYLKYFALSTRMCWCRRVKRNANWNWIWHTFFGGAIFDFYDMFPPHNKGRTIVMRACCTAHRNKVFQNQAGPDRNEPVRRVGDDTQKLQVPATYNHCLICVFLVFSSPFGSSLSIAAL